MRIDLHIHTSPRSACSHLGLAELIETVNQRKLDGICLTEHQVVWDMEEAQQLAADGDIKVFRGNEFTTNQGDILVFGFDEDIKELLTIQELQQTVKNAGGFLINRFADRPLIHRVRVETPVLMRVDGEGGEIFVWDVVLIHISLHDQCVQ